jgi:Sec-independent protein translocase protein TatA
LNAKNFDPAFAVNTNPDAMNGPPVVTQNGLVLGGNSRTMSMQLVYADFPNRADELRRYLKDLAPVFGLTEADVDAVQHPVLVRRLSADIQGFDDLRALVRQMNEGHSQKMTADVMGRALAAQLSDRSIAILGEGLTAQTDDDTQPTLRDFLTEYSDRFQHFVSALRTDGVITDTNVNTWIDQNHNVFTPTAVALLETVLLGKLFSDTQKLARLPPALRRSLVSALPSFLAVDDPQTRLRSLALAVEAYGMASSYFRPRDKAAQAVAAVQREWVDTLNTNTNEYDKQLIRELTDDPIANRLLVALIVFNGPRKLATAFRDIAAMTRGAGEQDVEDMFGQDTSELTLEQQLDSYLSGTVTTTYFVAPRDNSRMRQPRTDRGGLGELFRRKLDGVHLGRLYRALSNPR